MSTLQLLNSTLHLPAATSITSVPGTVPAPLVSPTSRSGGEGSFEEQWGCIKEEVGRGEGVVI